MKGESALHAIFHTWRGVIVPLDFFCFSGLTNHILPLVMACLPELISHTHLWYRVQKWWYHKKTFFFCILTFWIPCIGGAWWKTSTAQIWWESVHGGPEMLLHEHLISPIEISVNWHGSKQLWTRPVYTDFSGAN